MPNHQFFLSAKFLLAAGLLLVGATTILILSNKEPNKDYSSAVSVAKKPTKKEEPNNELTDQMTEIKQSISALGESIASQQIATAEKISVLEQAIEQLSENQTSNTVSDQTIEDTPTISSEELIRQQRELAIQKTMEFDQALAYEDRDSEWAPIMEESINTASKKELYSGSTFNDAVCKSTFCRIEAYHQNLDSQDNFELIRRELPNSFYIQHLGNAEDGSLRSVIYFVREGEESNNIIFQSLSDNG